MTKGQRKAAGTSSSAADEEQAEKDATAYYADVGDASGKASEIARTLALSAIAIIWIFVKQGEGVVQIPQPLLRAGLFVIGALILDLSQYLLSAVIWWAHGRKIETSGKPSYQEHHWFWPGLISFVFISKFICVGIAYAYLLRFFLAVTFVPFSN